VDFHAGAARIGKDMLHALAFERLHKNVAAGHRFAQFRPQSFFPGFSFHAHVFCFWPAIADIKKPTTVFQPWVFVESRLDATIPRGVAAYSDYYNQG
jgi:hypothetical protein